MNKSQRENKRTALVTGATGFVGSHLVRRLVKNEWNVNVIVRPSSNLDQLLETRDAAIVHLHDGTMDGVNEILEQTQPDVVFHLASLVGSEHQSADVEPLILSNVLFGTQLAEAMVNTGCPCMVNVGTFWQHYRGESYDPVNLYAATKQAFEDILQYYIQAKGLNVITLKLFDTYGPDDPRPKLFHFLKSLEDRGVPLDMSPGEQLVDFVFIDDVVEAFMLAAERLRTESFAGYERYVVSSGQPIRLKDLVELFSKITDKTIKVNWGGRAYREREVMVPWNAGRTLPGWSVKIHLEDGIKKLLS